MGDGGWGIGGGWAANDAKLEFLVVTLASQYLGSKGSPDGRGCVIKRIRGGMYSKLGISPPRGTKL